MTRVKICGVTRPEDALAAAAAGAWAVGLVFYARSPRFVTAARAIEIARVLPPGVLAVGVFMDSSVDVVRRVKAKVSLDLVQIHGSRAAETARALGPERVIVAVVLREEADVREAAEEAAEYALIDRRRIVGAPSGAAVDWGLAARLARSRPRTLLAGDLTAESVGDAVRRVRPWGVDVSGGVESLPGVKDARLVRDFLEAVRSADGGIDAG